MNQTADKSTLLLEEILTCNNDITGEDKLSTIKDKTNGETAFSSIFNDVANDNTPPAFIKPTIEVKEDIEQDSDSWLDEVGPDGTEIRLSQLLADENWDDDGDEEDYDDEEEK